MNPKPRDRREALADLPRSMIDAYRQETLADADWLASLDPPRVTAKPADVVRPTDDPHDYVSVGTYWWPNPETADGLPFVHRDGEFSPVIADYDRLRWDLHAEGIALLGQAGDLTDDPRYLQAAADWCQTWYVDSATRMNPHLRHAQMCPGHDTGRMVGCIDFTVRTARFIDAICDLAQASNAGRSIVEPVRAWWKRLYGWLISSEVRAWHEAAQNNIGVYYDLTVLRLAAWFDDEETQRRILDRVLDSRVDSQIEADGTMPHELRRTRSFSYVLMNTVGYIDLATLAQHRGVDLFFATSSRGRTIASAVDWLWDQAAATDPWPNAQIAPIDWDLLVRLWWCLAPTYRERYPLDRIAHRISPALLNEPRLALCHVQLHPFHRKVWTEYPHAFPPQPGAGSA
ncbi:MAG: alginate lyase family protein [Planctomycetota bacterium]